MLTIQIENDGEGTNESANYRYAVFVNQKEIERGAIQGHNRNDGWAALVMSIAKRHMRKPKPSNAVSSTDTSVDELGGTPRNEAMTAIEFVINKLSSFTDRGFQKNQAQCKAALIEYEELKQAADRCTQTVGKPLGE